MPSQNTAEFQPVSAYFMYKNQVDSKKMKKKRKRTAAKVAVKKLKKTETKELLKKEKHIIQQNVIEEDEEHMLSPNKNKHHVQKNIIKKRKAEEPPTLIQISEPDNESSLPHDDPRVDAEQLFTWMITPLSPTSFFKTYWEQKAVHIKRANRNYYTHILNSSNLDKILRNNSLYYTRNIDVVSYENGVKEVFNQEGKATASAVWDYYSNGCSIRILNPHTYNHKVHLLLATLQEYFGTMVGANVYLTPPGSQGFAPHYDDIEAFVIQLEGRKHWKLYQPRGADVLARYSSPNLKHEDIGDPFMELTLNAGEVLYFPRGTIHEGRTDEDSHSLHITVSVYQHTSYADLLQHILPAALKKAAENDVEFRKGLPLNYLKKFGVTTDSKDRKFVVSKVQDLIGDLIKFIDIDNAADQLGKKFMYDSMPPVLSKSETERSSKADGPYLKDGAVVNRVEIDLDTRVRLLRYYCIRLVCEENSPPKLYYNTENATVYHGEEEQWLELDHSMIPLIKMLQNLYPRYIEVEKLPMEDMAVKMQLVSDLWEHGLLVTEYPLDIIE